MLTLVLVVVLTALAFEFINGFHDTANSIATVVATKVLSPGQAVILAAGTNLIGAFAGTAVAKTIASGLVDTHVVNVTSQVILCALAGGITWNLITWWLGLPSSSSHSLIGGLCGAALAAANNNWRALIWSQTADKWTDNKGLLWKVFLPMVSSPIAGFLLGMLILTLLYAIIFGLSRAGGALARAARPRWVNAFFGKAQLVSAAYMGFGHRGRRLAHHQDARPQDGEAASDRWFRRRNGFRHDPGDRGAFRHAGVDHPQHLHRDHGRRFCQESARAEASRSPRSRPARGRRVRRPTRPVSWRRHPRARCRSRRSIRRADRA